MSDRRTPARTPATDKDVAELVAAIREYRKELRKPVGIDSASYQHACQRLDDALQPFGGWQ
jgi:hypothetical protein